MPLKELEIKEHDSTSHPNHVEKTLTYTFDGPDSSDEAWKIYSAYMKLGLVASVESSFNESLVTLYTVLPKKN